MADFEWLGEPDRSSLRRAIRHRLRHFDDRLRVIAEGFLAERTEIDLLAVGNEGNLVSIRIGRAGGDAVLFTKALSDLSWLRARREHLLKLAPGLGLEPSAEPRALLLCPDFSRETSAAAKNLPAHMVQQLSYRCLRLQGQLTVLLTDENMPAPGSGPPQHGRGPEFPPEAVPRGARSPHANLPVDPPPGRLTDPPSPSGFRTGLADSDLGRPTPPQTTSTALP